MPIAARHSAISCSVLSAVDLVRVQWSDIRREPGSPAADVMRNLRERGGNGHLTVLMTASDRNLNEQTLSYLGNVNGGSIDARRLGRSKGQSSLAREQAQWWILATGNQGTSRKSAQQLSRAVRQDSRFERVQSWPCLLYTSPSPRDAHESRMPSSA